MAVLTGFRHTWIAKYIRKNKCQIWKCKTLFCHLMVSPIIGGCEDSGEKKEEKVEGLKSVMVIYGPADSERKNNLIVELFKGNQAPVEWIVTVDTAEEVSAQLAQVPLDFVFRPGMVAFLCSIGAQPPNERSLNAWADKFESSLCLKTTEDAQWLKGKKDFILAKDGTITVLIMWRELNAASVMRYASLIEDAFHECTG